MREVLLSGCTAQESSYDDLIDGSHHGAMTYYALKTIRDARYKLTYQTLHKGLLYHLNKAKYDQHPQLEGQDEHKQRQIFT